jgi:hypothetical protein
MARGLNSYSLPSLQCTSPFDWQQDNIADADLSNRRDLNYTGRPPLALMPERIFISQRV